MKSVFAGAAAAALLMLTACGADEVGIPPPHDELVFPLGLAAHPDGRYLYITNAVFDRRYNRGTVVVYDTFERRLLPDATVEIGLFAGMIELARFPAEQPDGEPVLRGYVATRGDNRLTALRIDASRGPLPGHLSCDETPEGICDGRAVVDAFRGETTSVPLADDPYGLAVDGDGMFVSHLEDGVVSRWRFARPAEPAAPDVGLPTFGCAVNLPEGASNVARHPTLGWAYVTDRSGSRIQVVETLDPGDRGELGVTSLEACRLETRSPITIDELSGGGRTRGLAFSADGSLLYVATGGDDSLRIYDTSVAPGGRPRNRLVAAIPLGNGPNVVRVAGLRPGEQRPPGGPDRGPVGRVVDEKGQGLVYVTAFDDNRVIVVDPTTLSVVGRIDVGDGPHEIAFLPDGAGELRGYVTNFNDHSLSVLDLEPGSPSRFTELATVP